jgi:hypothetical protein
MDESTPPLALIGPEAADPAVSPFVGPFFLIETALPVERRGDLVAVARAALRKLLAAGQMERDVMEHGSLPKTAASLPGHAIVAELRRHSLCRLDPDQQGTA